MRRRSSIPRRRLAPLKRLGAACVLAAPALLFEGSSVASGTGVPAGLQAELLSKLASYDRSYGARAGSRAQVLIVTKAGEPRSTLHAAVMKSELGKIEHIGGLPHRETSVHFEGGAALAKRCRAESIDIVYFAPGLEKEVPEICAATAFASSPKPSTS